jgi:hypothetical protein
LNRVELCFNSPLQDKRYFIFRWHGKDLRYFDTGRIPVVQYETSIDPVVSLRRIQVYDLEQLNWKVASMFADFMAFSRMELIGTKFYVVTFLLVQKKSGDMLVLL